MKISLRSFGIAKDIVGHPQLQMEIREGATIADVKKELVQTFPKFEALVKFSIAASVQSARTSAVPTLLRYISTSIGINRTVTLSRASSKSYKDLSAVAQPASMAVAADRIMNFRMKLPT